MIRVQGVHGEIVDQIAGGEIIQEFLAIIFLHSNAFAFSPPFVGIAIILVSLEDFGYSDRSSGIIGFQGQAEFGCGLGGSARVHTFECLAQAGGFKAAVSILAIMEDADIINATAWIAVKGTFTFNFL